MESGRKPSLLHLTYKVYGAPPAVHLSYRNANGVLSHYSTKWRARDDRGHQSE